MLKYLIVGEILLFLVMIKKNKGFTLTETLLTITILVILFVLAVPGIFSIKKNLRQMELDDKAEIIYTAVQNRLTELYTSGLSDYYNPESNDVLKSLNEIPTDYIPSVDLDSENKTIDFYYFTSADLDKLNKLLGNNTIDESLKGGHFVVEYMPYALRDVLGEKSLTVPFVYAVYYSENEVDVSNDYGANDDYLNRYRVKQNRLQGGARVGYYGGSTPGSGSVTKNLTINSVNIYSEEEVNKAIVKGRIGAGIDYKTVIFTFEFKDESGHVTKYTYEPAVDVVYDDTDTMVNKDFVKVSKIGNNYTFNFLLDDLSKDATRFKNLFPKLNPGDDITLTVNATSTDGTVFDGFGETIGNSIFDYVADKQGKTNTAFISNGRHLQNLDNSSNVVAKYNNALLLDEINFGKDSKFYDNYKNSYFNGFMSIYKISDAGKVNVVRVPRFKSITNNNLNVFDGDVIKELSTTIGLFNSINNTLNISNLSLTGVRVYGNEAVGGLAGSIGASGDVTIENCGIYLVSNVDIPTTIKPEYYLESIRWIYGKTSGGLVGVNYGTLNISSSFVATNIGTSEKDTITGGLVGNNLGNLYIDKSYADCYLYGYKVGGLVGSSYNTDKTFNLTNSYSAGFIITDTDGGSSAGLVSGSTNNISNSYTVVYKGLLNKDRNAANIKGFYGLKAKDLNDTTPYYATVEFINNLSNVYYKNDNNNTGGSMAHGTQSDSMVGINLGSAYSFDIASHPYKMMGTSLTYYNYPKLNNMEHYGDWAAGFVAGSLVYYEKYDDDTFGFDGANVAISLTAEKEIKGDGYGVVFETNEIRNRLNESFTIDLNDSGNKTIKFNSTSYESGKYTIYPLDFKDVNPTSAIDGFYEKCVINQGTSGKLTFFFNPHFGRSVVESETKPSKVQGDITYIRSPRHLNNLALYFNAYRNILGSSITYKQERKMDYVWYDWSFGNRAAVNEQTPIGADTSNSFNATYDGGCFEINNVNFKTYDGTYVGLFGYNEGTIKNVVVATQYAKDKTSYHVKREKAVADNQEAYFGVLVGYNKGDIDNCAIAGYYLSGSDGKIHGYRNSNIYIGGLVGFNSNEGLISNSSADLPKLSLAMNSSIAYAGSFVGYNEGIINNTYGISMIEANAPTGDTKIAGFAGYNTGTINNSYCATALVSSGNGSSTYNFSPKEGGGYVYNSYYLNGSSYQYIDDLYAYSGDIVKSSGTPKTYNELVNLKGKNSADFSKYHKLTTDLDSLETIYPYRAIVKDNDDRLVHYGEWQVKPELGVLGVFYWEHEIDGENNGYKITYVGSANGDITVSSNLCNEHDDRGVISEYGYGYYYGIDNKYDVTTDFKNLAYSNKVNELVKAELEKQIPNIKFFPFTTRGDNADDFIYLHTNDSTANGKIVLTQNEKDYNFTISPFFANAISFNTGDAADTQDYVNKEPGTKDNPYEIRSAEQLQYLNWNYNLNNNNTLSEESNKNKFTYLTYDENEKKIYQFKQSHDINAQNISNFVPIAGQNKTNYAGYKAKLSTWFGGTFDGQSYKIQELNINSKSFTVGLFGVTCGATLENIILYSTKDAIIQRNTESTDPSGAYGLGGLAGVAYDYKNRTNNVIRNCSIAGYQIIDNSNNEQDLGEANVGGLVGISNIAIDRCSAVVDIKINCEHRDKYGNFTKAEWGNFIRVGGMAGAVFGEVSNSYTGGSIQVSENVLNENYNEYGTQFTKDSDYGIANKRYSTNIYLSGIAGSGFSINFDNITGEDSTAQGSPNINNCYTYMTFPTFEGTIRSITMFASIADRYSNQAGTKAIINNCYYLDKSAEFEWNLPKFAIKDDGDSQTLSVQAVMDKYSNKIGYGNDLKQSMILGETYFIHLTHKKVNDYNLSSIDSNASINNANSKTYNELSAPDMNNILNKDAFATVTSVDESGFTVDGKYSFSAGELALEGKNYPFPTVIRQNDNGNEVKVHYGTWPFVSAYFEKGNDTIDIFDDMDSDNFAYKEFKLISNGKELRNLNVAVGNEEYAQIISVNKVDNDYIVKVKALKTGATDINASWIDENNIGYYASFNLSITAKLNINIDPNNIHLNTNERATYTIGNNIQVISSNGTDYSNKIYDWTFVSSKVGFDDEAEPAFTISRTGKNLTIESNGYNGNVVITATYIYNGNSYTANSNININTRYTVGLKGDTYVETSIKDDGSFNNATNKTYGSTTGPLNSENNYFVYERNDETGIKDLIQNINNISLSSDDSTTQALLNDVRIELSNNIESNSINHNDYNSRAINLTFKSNVSMTINCTLNVVVNNGTILYTLSSPVTIISSPYSLTLDANGGTIDGQPYKKIDLETGNVVNLSDYNSLIKKTGYLFGGWYDGETKYDTYSVEEPPVDKTLKASWAAASGKLRLNSNFDGATVENQDINRTYDDFSKLLLPVISRDSYILDGFYDQKENGNKIIDADGTIIKEDLYKKYLLTNIEDSSSMTTLYAHWIEGAKIILNAKDEKGIPQTKELPPYKKGSILSSIPLNQTWETEEYKFAGYINKNDGKLIITKEGNFVSQYTLDENLELTAVFYKTGYKKVDNFTNNKDYLIVSRDQAMSNITLNGLEISFDKDISNKDYIPSNDNTLVWKYDSGVLKNYDLSKSLRAYYRLEWGYVYYLITNTDNQKWEYSLNDKSLSTNDGTGTLNWRLYVDLNNLNEFIASRNKNQDIELYEKSDDILVDCYQTITREGGME